MAVICMWVGDNWTMVGRWLDNEMKKKERTEKENFKPVLFCCLKKSAVTSWTQLEEDLTSLYRKDWPSNMRGAFYSPSISLICHHLCFCQSNNKHLVASFMLCLKSELNIELCKASKGLFSKQPNCGSISLILRGLTFLITSSKKSHFRAFLQALFFIWKQIGWSRQISSILLLLTEVSKTSAFLL